MRLARVAARARGRDDLTPAERDRLARLRGELGGALRAARERHIVAAAEVPLVVAPPAVPHRWPWRFAAVATAVAAVLVVIALFPPRSELPAGGAPPPAEEEQSPLPTLADLSRGISITPLSAAEPTPRPTARPERSPRPSRPPSTGVPGGVGTGGSGGGTGEGGTSTAPITQTTFSGYVVDAQTGKGIPHACVVIGFRECSETERPVYTDASGYFSITLPAPNEWDFNFVHPDYVSAYRKGIGDKTNVSFGRIPLQPH